MTLKELCCDDQFEIHCRQTSLDLLDHAIQDPKTYLSKLSNARQVVLIVSKTPFNIVGRIVKLSFGIIGIVFLPLSIYESKPKMIAYYIFRIVVYDPSNLISKTVMDIVRVVGAVLGFASPKLAAQLTKLTWQSELWLIKQHHIVRTWATPPKVKPIEERTINETDPDQAKSYLGLQNAVQLWQHIGQQVM